MSQHQADITFLFRAAASGERRDLDALMSAIYGDMRRLAASQMKGERHDHTLQPTALVHEAYVKLVNQRSTDWKDRVHFFSIASRVIRRILTDHARERQALKRGGDQKPVCIEHLDISAPVREVNLVALDEALVELAQLCERQARIVELRFFGGLTIPEIATALSIGHRSVDRDWQVARAWLFHRLSELEMEPSDVDGE